MEVVFRGARPEDEPAIAEVLAAAWRAVYRGLMPPRWAEVGSDEILARRAGRRRGEEPERWTWVAEVGGSVVGYASSGPTRDGGTGGGGTVGRVAELFSFYVAPAWWRRGIGRGLMGSVLEDLWVRGYAETRLWCLAANAPARAFYERAGFTRRGTDVFRDLEGVELLHAGYRIGSPLAPRVAVPGDAPALGRLSAAAWRAAYAGLVPDGLLEARGAERGGERFARLLTEDAPERRVWVLEAAGGLLGYCATGPARDDDATPATGEIAALYVAPDVVARGHGGRLLEHALGDLACRGYAESTVWVLAANGRGRRFYEAHGFRLDVQRAARVHDGHELEDARYRRRP